MEFVVVASLMVIIAMVIGGVTNKRIIDKKENNSLYDKETIDIMKTYKLIDDKEYRLMLAELKEKDF